MVKYQDYKFKDYIMKKSSMILMFVVSTLSASFVSSAASVEVTWTNPEKYRDIRPGNESRKTFQEKVFSDLNEHFSKLANNLAENYVLKIDVTDVDLAGDVNFGSSNRPRVISDLYFPRLKFTYKLVDETDKVIKAGGMNLKDMNFMMHSNMRYRNENFGYEKQMIDKWFGRTFTTMLANN